MRRAAFLGAGLLVMGCATAGSTWMSEAESASTERTEGSRAETVREPAAPGADPTRFKTRVISDGAEPEPLPSAGPSPREGGEGSVSFGGGGSRPAPPKLNPGEGKVLGTFRNTYYDFPNATDFQGDSLPLKDARCESIASVPRGFFEAVCVQGSGILANGRPVGFAKRDCECAEECPRTGQRICFEALDPARFPWGRGARGLPITPLLTVAVDDTVVPLGTSLYVPEFDGAPRDGTGAARHDGCFLAEDRGLRVKGQHLDVFTGSSDMTALWNRLIPSNRGVTVVVGSPKCARAEASETAARATEPSKRKADPKEKTQKARPASR